MDANELEESRARLSADPDLGLTPDERSARIKQATQFAKTVSTTTLVAGFWTLVYPPPYLPVIAALALLPLVAMFKFVRSKGLYDLEGRRNEVRPRIALALFPGPVLAMRALRDLHLLHWPSVIPGAVIVAGVMILILARTGGEKHKTSLPILLLFVVVFASYAGCVIVDANTLLDRSSLYPTELRFWTNTSRMEKARATIFN